MSSANEDGVNWGMLSVWRRIDFLKLYWNGSRRDPVEEDGRKIHFVAPTSGTSNTSIRRSSPSGKIYGQQHIWGMIGGSSWMPWVPLVAQEELRSKVRAKVTDWLSFQHSRCSEGDVQNTKENTAIKFVNLMLNLFVCCFFWGEGVFFVNCLRVWHLENFFF